MHGKLWFYSIHSNDRQNPPDTQSGTGNDFILASVIAHSTSGTLLTTRGFTQEDFHEEQRLVQQRMSGMTCGSYEMALETIHRLWLMQEERISVPTSCRPKWLRARAVRSRWGGRFALLCESNLDKMAGQMAALDMGCWQSVLLIIDAVFPAVWVTMCCSVTQLLRALSQALNAS